MSLQRKKLVDLPPDAIVLSQNEALKYQNKILKNWKITSDVFGYKYGRFLLGGAGFFTGFFINSYYRQKLKLRSYGVFATFLPTTVIPAVFSAVMHSQFVLDDVLLQRKNTCPVCLEVRAAAVQASIGVIFPTVLSAFTNLGLANRYLTLPVPNIIEEPKKLWNFVKVKSLPLVNVMFFMVLGHAFLASFVTYLEHRSVFNVNRKLELLEQKLENS